MAGVQIFDAPPPTWTTEKNSPGAANEFTLGFLSQEAIGEGDEKEQFQLKRDIVLAFVEGINWQEAKSGGDV